MARKRRENHETPGELNLTAMIDVAFQLLNFFVISSHPMDVMTNMDIFRPAPESEITEPPPVDITMLEIMVHANGYAIQKHNVRFEELDRQLTKLAATSKNVSVVIKCTGDSPHTGLVNVLDLCSKVKLTKLAVFSM